MKYVSIDIETTGLSETKHQILSIAAIIEDTNLKLSYQDIPKINIVILREDITGSIFALNMHKDLIELINRRLGMDKNDQVAINAFEDLVFCSHSMVFKTEDEAALYLYQWLKQHNYYEDDPNTNEQKIYITAAGKNFATFDKKFLEIFPRWKQYFKFRSRVIDPAQHFMNWKEDKELPNLFTCKQRSGLFTDNTVTHNGLDDAWDVIRLMRTQY